MGTHLDEFNIISIEFLRRGMSIHEILKTNFEVATTDSYKQVKGQLNSDHFLFCDHSLCALFTLKLSKMLEENHLQSLSLIVSGNAGPGLKKYTGMASLNSEDFIRELKKLRGLPDELPERFTRTHFNSDIVDGDHFLIYRHAKWLSEVIKQACYDKSLFIKL